MYELLYPGLGKIKLALEAQVTGVCTGHQTGFIVKSNW